MPVIPAVAAAATRGAVIPIGYVKLTTPGVDILFNNIPQTYTDLMLVCTTRGGYTNLANAVNVYFGNTTSAANWSQTAISSDGTTVYSYRSTTAGPTYGANTSDPSAWTSPNFFGTATFHILNYTNTSYNKMVLSRGAYDAGLNVGMGTTFAASLFQSTSAVTALTIGSGYGANFAIGSTFALYGIRSVGQ